MCNIVTVLKFLNDMKRWLVLVMISSWFLFACGGGEVVRSDRYLLNDLNTLKDSIFLPDNEMDVTVVPLESSKECFLGKIAKVMLSRDFIFILSDNYVYQFNRDGKFVRTIGILGRGPQEYLKINDFTINEERGAVYIADNENIVLYDFSGGFISKTKMGFFRRFDVTDDGKFVVNPPNLNGKDLYKLVVFNESGDTLARFKNSVLYNSKMMYMWFQLKNISRVGGELIFQQQHTDTVYTINSKNLTLDYRYSFDFGSNALTNKMLEEGLEAVNRSIYIKDLTESTDFIYLLCKNQKMVEKIAVNKSSGKSYRPGFYIPQLMFDFWPKWQYQDSLLIDYIPASHIIEKRDSLPKSRFDSVTSGINENSNPTLVIVKFR